MPVKKPAPPPPEAEEIASAPVPVLPWVGIGVGALGLIVGAAALLRPAGEPAGIVTLADLSARLDRQAAAVRGEVKGDLAAETKRFADTVERITRSLDAERQRLRALTEDVARRGTDAATTADSRLAKVEGRAEDAAKTLSELREGLARLGTQVAELAARPVATAPAAPAKPESPKPEAPKPEAAPPAPAPEAAPPAPPPTPKERVQAWIADLASPDVAKVFPACIGLAKAGDLEAVLPIAKVLQEHKDPYARQVAAKALGDLKGCDGVPALIEAFADKSDEVVVAAAYAFRAITGERVSLSAGASKKEKSEERARWTAWWKDHETDIRARLGQAVGGVPPGPAPAPGAPGR